MGKKTDDGPAKGIAKPLDIRAFASALKTGRTLGLTSITQAVVLCDLAERDHGSWPSAIAERAGVSSAAITSVLDVLVRLQFIVREPNSDRRSYRVLITQNGLQALYLMLP